MSEHDHQLPIELLQSLEQLSPTQLAWLSGYSWAKSQGNVSNLDTVSNEQNLEPKVLILSASQTGNARRIAEQLNNYLNQKNIATHCVSVSDYKSKDLAKENILLFVCSTQGEGEPPEEAISFKKFLLSKKAPNLSQLSFAVLGLGDSSYPQFCQAAKDFDEHLEKLGAKHLLPRVDCDLDFQATAEAWIEDIGKELESTLKTTSSLSIQTITTTKNKPVKYTKESPYTAHLLGKQKITSRDANKDIEHIEIDLGDSGLNYEPGDALGVWFENSAQLIEEILENTSLNSNEKLQHHEEEITLFELLQKHLELTQNTPAFVRNYAKLSKNKKLLAYANDTEKLLDYVATTPLAGVLSDFPQKISAEQLYGLLRPLTPRLYSIASAQDEVGEEVHLTVSLINYEYKNRTYFGGASGFLIKTLEEGDEVKIYIEPNRNFKLPQDGSQPILMIGAGTGIAPFRSFIQQRSVNGDKGKNWLIFGNQKFTDDFLYQAEWLKYRDQSLLYRADLAWSRQQKNKIYVQHKLLEAAKDVWAYIQEGAHIYVCGDANKMAKDVEEALLKIISEQCPMNHEEADDYLDNLRQEKRYQRDVY